MTDRVILHESECRNYEMKCYDCKSPQTVYGMVDLSAGIVRAFCYPCLLKRCQKVGSNPYPLEVSLNDKLKHDLGWWEGRPWWEKRPKLFQK